MKTYRDLIAAGYRRVSNSCQMVTRVDREDWQEWMAQQHAGGIEVGRGWVRVLVRDKSAADHYRRVYSKDRLLVDPKTYKKIPSSNHDETGFVKSP